MKKKLKKRIETHVLAHCVHVPYGFSFTVENMFLYLRKNNEGSYVPGQASYEVYCEDQKISTGYVNLTSI